MIIFCLFFSTFSTSYLIELNNSSSIILNESGDNGKKYIKAVYCHLAYLTYMQSVCVLVSQSCPTVCDPIDCGPQCSSVHGILQARILEWVAIPFSKGSSWPRDWTQVSRIAGRLYMQSTSCEMPSWMKHKLESKLSGEVSITSDMQMTPLLWKKVKKD